jgi:hypothetical protein
MTILAAIKREERRLEKQLSKLQHRLNGVRTPASALGHPTSKGFTGVKKRVLSPAGRSPLLPEGDGQRLGSRRRK